MQKVWVNHPTKCWVLGAMQGTAPHGQVRVMVDGEEVVTRRDNVVNATTDNNPITDNLLKLDQIAEPSILHNIRERYLKDNFYSQVGPVVISVNPWKDTRRFYTEDFVKLYTGNSMILPPHLFKVARQAYASLVFFKQPQSIILSGECGSGKSEAAKFILKYLTIVGDSSKNKIASGLLAVNALLEAFGHARTIRNDNSSRFTKLTQLQFDHFGRLRSASIHPYALETTRVISQDPNESNFHIFYQFLRGTPPQSKRLFKLFDSPSQYHYLSNSKSTQEMDPDGFSKIMAIFNLLDISDNEIRDIFMFLSAILNLGNIQFVLQDDRIEIKDEGQLQTVSELLQISKEDLRNLLTHKPFDQTAVSKPQGISSLLSPRSRTNQVVHISLEQATQNRDLLAEILYQNVFNYVVDKVNLFLKGHHITPPSDLTSLYILDVSGFEDLVCNGLDQLHINLIDDVVHSHLYEKLKAEQELYKKDGLKWSHIDIPEFCGCTDVLIKSKGIMDIIDEESRNPSGSTETLIQKLVTTFKQNPNFSFNPRFPDSFSLKHGLGMVQYNTKLFLLKNKIYLNEEVTSTLKSSKMPLLAYCFSGKIQPINPTKLSSALFLKQQIDNLISILNQTKEHYVKCIKPNDLNKPSMFDGMKVISQVRCHYLLELSFLCKNGFSWNETADVIIERLELLGIYTDTINLPTLLTQLLKPTEFAIGDTKIFLREAAVETLIQSYQNILNKSIVNIQKYIRGSLVMSGEFFDDVSLSLSKLDNMPSNNTRQRSSSSSPIPKSGSSHIDHSNLPKEYLTVLSPSLVMGLPETSSIRRPPSFHPLRPWEEPLKANSNDVQSDKSMEKTETSKPRISRSEFAPAEPSKKTLKPSLTIGKKVVQDIDLLDFLSELKKDDDLSSSEGSSTSSTSTSTSTSSSGYTPYIPSTDSVKKTTSSSSLPTSSPPNPVPTANPVGNSSPPSNPVPSTPSKTTPKPKKGKKKLSSWPAQPPPKMFPKLLKHFAPIKLILLNEPLLDIFQKYIQKQKKEVWKYLRCEEIILELIDYVLCIGAWEGAENVSVLCEMSSHVLTLDCDAVLDGLVEVNCLSRLFCFYEEYHCTRLEAQKKRLSMQELKCIPNNLPYFDRIILHVLDKRPQQIVNFLQSKGDKLFSILVNDYLIFTETAVLFGEIIFQEERMRVKGVAAHTRWRGWYIEHDLIARMQKLFVADPEKYAAAFSEFTRILSTFPAQSLSHQFFFQPLYENNIFPVIFFDLLARASVSSEVAQIIFYLWQMAMRAGPELQTQFVNQVGVLSQNNAFGPLIKSPKACVSFNTLKVIELLLAEAAAYELIQNTILDIIDVFFERKKRNVDHWSITVIMGLVFNNPDFKGPFLTSLFTKSRLIERLMEYLNPQKPIASVEIMPFVKELGKMLPEEVKTTEWRALEAKVFNEDNPDAFEISDELRYRYKKNSKYLKNAKGLKTVLDELELVK